MRLAVALTTLVMACAPQTTADGGADASDAGICGVVACEQCTTDAGGFALIAQGMSNAEIAGELCISPATTKTHVGHLLTKLAARDRVHLVILAYQAGIVMTG